MYSKPAFSLFQTALPYAVRAAQRYAATGSVIPSSIKPAWDLGKKVVKRVRDNKQTWLSNQRATKKRRWIANIVTSASGRNTGGFMPFRKRFSGRGRFQRRGRRPTYRRKKRFIRRKTKRKPPSGFPMKYFAKFETEKRFTLQHGTLAYDSALLSPSDFSDPFGAESTGKSRWHTEISGIYDQYRVTSCKIECFMINDTNQRIFVGVRAQENATTIPSNLVVDLRNYPRTKHAFLFTSSATGAESNSGALTLYRRSKHLVAEFRDEDSWTDIGSSPTAIYAWNYNVWMVTEGDVAFTGSTIVHCKMTQYVQFRKQDLVAQE